MLPYCISVPFQSRSRQGHLHLYKDQIKMSGYSNSALPKKFWYIRDACVEQVLTNSPPPSDLILLQNWLLEDGYDELLAAWIDEDMVMDIKLFARSFSDGELRDWNNRQEIEEITDKMRLEFARDLICSSIDASDDDNLSVHSYMLQRDDGKNAILGFTIASLGQGGLGSPTWHGLFADQATFYSHLNKSGLLLHEELKALSEPKILALWQAE